MLDVDGMGFKLTEQASDSIGRMVITGLGSAARCGHWVRVFLQRRFGLIWEQICESQLFRPDSV